MHNAKQAPFLIEGRRKHNQGQPRKPAASSKHLSKFDHQGVALVWLGCSLSTGILNGFCQNHLKVSQLGNSIFFTNPRQIHYFPVSITKSVLFKALLC